MIPEKKILDKRNFQRIKCMNYVQMLNFITNIYESGFKDGQADSAGLDEVEVLNVLMNIPDIGPKRAQWILNALNTKLDDEQKLYYPCGNCGHDLYHVKGAKFCPECGFGLNWEE